jgi:hypothetical protein
MRTTKLNNVLLFVLITAFLAIEWTASHIHLSQKHNHSGSHHQHKVENHKHDLTHKYAIDYAVDIDGSHELSHTNIVDIDHQYTLSKSEKQKFTSLTLAPPSILLQQPFIPTSVKIPVNVNTKLSYFDRYTVNPRAPPKTS